jgi:hypothetical protein
MTVPMLLIVWRILQLALNYSPSRPEAAQGIPARHRSDRTLITVAAGCFLALNIVSVEANTEWETMLPEAWRCLSMALTLAIFAGGVWGLGKVSVVAGVRTKLSTDESADIVHI